MKAIKRNFENEIKVVNQLMADLNKLTILTNEEELGNFAIQAIKNIPDIEYCSLCLKGIEFVIGHSSEYAKDIVNLLKTTPLDDNNLVLPPASNKNLELINLQISTRNYGYLLYSIKPHSDKARVKPIISNFINIVTIDLERRWQIKHGNNLKQKVEKRTENLNKEIEKRKHIEISLKNNQELLTKSQEIAKIGSWSLNLISNQLIWSNEVYHIFGLDPQEFEVTYEAFLDIIHPDDREKVDKAFINSIKEGKDSYEIEHRIINKKTQQIHYVIEKCHHKKDASGKVILSTGMILDNTESKLREKLLQESEMRFKDVFDKSSDALLIIKNGIFIDCNEATVKMLGYSSKKEFLGVHPSELSPKKQPDGKISWEKAQDMIRLAFKNNSHHFEWIHSKKNKENFPVEVLLTAITNKPNNKILYCVWRDITNRKKIEKSLIRSYEIINSSPIVVFLWDESEQWNTKFVSKNVIDLLGYRAEEFLKNKISYKDLIHPEDIQRINKELFKHFKSNHAQELIQEYRIITKSGEIKWVRDFPSIEKFENGKVKYFNGVLQDITEQKLTKDKIKISEQHYRNLFDHSPVALWEEDFSEVKIFINKLKKRGIKNIRNYLNRRPEIVKECVQMIKILRINNLALELYEADTKEELMKNLQNIFTEKYLAVFKEQLIALADGQKKLLLEGEVKTLKGKLKCIRIEWVLLEDNQKKLDKVLLSTIDITEKKQADEIILKNLLHLDNAQKIAKLGYSERNLTTGKGFWSEGLFQIIGLKPNKIPPSPQNLIDRVHPDHQKELKLKYQKITKKEGKFDLEIKYFKTNKDIGWVHIISKTNYNNQGELIQYTIFKDITSRKQAEKEFKKNSELLINLSAQVPGVIYQFLLRPDGTSCFPYSSNGIKEIYGITPEQVKQSAAPVFDAIHPDDLKHVRESIQYSADNLSPWRDEYRVILPNKSTPSWREAYALPKKLEDGSTLWYGFVTNIDQRKQTEKELKEALNITQLGTFIFDDSTDLFETSSICDKILGIDQSYKKDIPGWINFIHPDDYENAQLLVDNTELKSDPIEMRIIRPKDNKTIWILAYIKKEYDNKGVRTKITGTIQDITYRIEVEKALKKSEEQLSIMFNKAPLGIALVDSLTGAIYKSNLEFEKITGRSKSEMKHTSWMNITHPDDLPEDLENMELLNSGKIKGYKMNKRYIQPDGTIIWINMTIAPLDLDDKKQSQHLCMIEDITESKIAELNFLSSQQHLKIAQDIAKLGYFKSNITTAKTTWSDGLYKILGYKPNEIEPSTENFHKLIHPDDLEDLITIRQNAHKSQGRVIKEFRLFNKYDQLKWFVFSGETKNTENGELIISGILQDISSRKESEEAILKEKELLKTVIDKIPVMLTKFNSDAKILYLNTEFEKIIGWKTEEVQNIDMVEKVYPDPKYRKKALNYMKKASSDWKEFKVLSKYGDIIDSEWSNMKLEDGTRIGIGIDIRERKRFEKELTKHQEHLEDLVKNRTIELEKKNRELDKAMKVFVGRELKIRELQKKIEEMEK